MRPGGRRVNSGSLGSLTVHPGTLDSLGCVLLVEPFSRDRWVHWGAPWGSSGSSGVAWVTGVRNRGRCDNSGWLGSLLCALGVVGFIRVCRFHWVAPRGSSGSSAFVAFIWVRPCGRRFHPWSLGALWCAVVVVGFI